MFLILVRAPRLHTRRYVLIASREVEHHRALGAGQRAPKRYSKRLQHAHTMGSAAASPRALPRAPSVRVDP